MDEDMRTCPVNNMKFTTEKELFDTWNNVRTRSCKPDMIRLANNYITDEDKSVKWNREQVEKNHKEYDKQVALLEKKKNEEMSEVMHDIYDYISDKAGVRLSNQTAEKIWQHHRKSGHLMLSPLCEFVGDIIRSERQHMANALREAAPTDVDKAFEKGYQYALDDKSNCNKWW